MTQYFTDFSEYTAGAQPSDWTERFVTANITWLVQNSVVSGVTGGKVLQITRTGANGRSMLSWDDIDGDANRANIEILFKSQHPTIASGMRAMVRGSGSAGSENAWYGGHNATTEALGGYVAGTFSAGTTATTFAPTAGVWYWTRARWNNGTSGQRQLRMWDDGDAEPGTWDIDDVDTAILGAGWAGLFSFSQSNTGHIVDVIGIGTNGDTAPASLGTVDVPSAADLALSASIPSTSVSLGPAEVSAPAPAQLSLTSSIPVVGTPQTFDEFECGQCDTAKTVVTNGDTLTPTIELYARPGVNTEGATPANVYYSMVVRVDNIHGKTPVFDINLDEPGEVIQVYGGGGFDAAWRCWFTYDPPWEPGATYFRLANSAVSGNYQRVSHSSAFTQNSGYLVTRPIYTHTMVRAHIDSISSSPHVSMPPSSAGNDFVHTTTTATTRDGDGLTVPALGMFSYKITDDSSSPDDGTPKRIAVLMAGQHATEPQGNWILEGSIDYLLSGAADANNLLKHWEFYVYPMVNCTGIYGHAYRGTCQAGQRDQDLNRDWPGGATPNRLNEQIDTRAAILADTGDNIDAVLDYHGRLEIDNTLFYFDNYTNSRFYTNLNAIYTTVPNIISGTAGSAPRYYRENFGVNLANTPEGDGILANGSQDLTEYTLFGEAIMQALDDSFVAGDFPKINPSTVMLTLGLFTPDVAGIVEGGNVTATGVNLGKGVSYTDGVVYPIDGVGSRGVVEEV